MSAFPGLTPGTWTVDPTHTEVGFVARHLMVAKVRGRFAEVAGSVTAGESFADTTLEAVVQAGSIHTCLLYTSPSPRDRTRSRMPSSA